MILIDRKSQVVSCYATWRTCATLEKYLTLKWSYWSVRRSFVRASTRLCTYTRPQWRCNSKSSSAWWTRRPARRTLRADRASSNKTRSPYAASRYSAPMWHAWSRSSSSRNSAASRSAAKAKRSPSAKCSRCANKYSASVMFVLHNTTTTARQLAEWIIFLNKKKKITTSKFAFFSFIFLNVILFGRHKQSGQTNELIIFKNLVHTFYSWSIFLIWTILFLVFILTPRDV